MPEDNTRGLVQPIPFLPRLSSWSGLPPLVEVLYTSPEVPIQMDLTTEERSYAMFQTNYHICLIITWRINMSVVKIILFSIILCH